MQENYKISKHSHFKEAMDSNGNVLKYNIYLTGEGVKQKISLVLTANELISLQGMMIFFNLIPDSRNCFELIVNTILSKSSMKLDKDKTKDNKYGKLHILLPDDKKGLIIF